MPLDFCLFIDENHCNNQHVRHALEQSAIRYESYLDHFSRGIPDTKWLPFVGQHGWALLTTDKHIRKHKLERQAVETNKVAMFYFSTNNLSGRQLGEALEKALPAMQSLFQRVVPPFFAAITRSGAVHHRTFND